MNPLLAVLLVLVIGACTPTPPTDFYTLMATSDPDAGQSDPSQGPVIGIGPIILPQYLDRPQIVRRGSGNQILLADFDSWAEPFQSMVERVLVQDIGRLVRTNNVVALPQTRDVVLDYRVGLELFSFEASSTGQVVLEGRWQVYEDSGNFRDPAPYRSQRTYLDTRIADPNDYDQIAQAMSELLGRLSQEIATALIAIPKA